MNDFSEGGEGGIEMYLPASSVSGARTSGWTRKGKKGKFNRTGGRKGGGHFLTRRMKGTRMEERIIWKGTRPRRLCLRRVRRGSKVMDRKR